MYYAEETLEFELAQSYAQRTKLTKYFVLRITVIIRKQTPHINETSPYQLNTLKQKEKKSY